MSTNKILRGDRLDATLAAIAASGDVVVVGDVIGIAQVAGAIGDTIALDTEGVFECPKATGQSWAPGNTLYWDAAAKNFTTSAAAGANKRAGIAWSTNVNGDVTGWVKLNPFVG